MTKWMTWRDGLAASKPGRRQDDERHVNPESRKPPRVGSLDRDVREDDRARDSREEDESDRDDGDEDV